MKIIIVKTYFEETIKDAEKYLMFNGYGSVKNIKDTDMYICILGKDEPKELTDVKIIDSYIVNNSFN